MIQTPRGSDGSSGGGGCGTGPTLGPGTQTLTPRTRTSTTCTLRSGKGEGGRFDGLQARGDSGPGVTTPEVSELLRMLPGGQTLRNGKERPEWLPIRPTILFVS